MKSKEYCWFMSGIFGGYFLATKDLAALTTACIAAVIAYYRDDIDRWCYKVGQRIGQHYIDKKENNARTKLRDYH